MSASKSNKMNARFFESTRGRIVLMLRGALCTVEELAGKLKLTDNAVRAHLATLERDGLVRQAGARAGFRKPHYTYTLTPEAESLFPKAYDALLVRLVSVLKEKVSAAKLNEIMHEVGGGLADAHPRESGAANLEARVGSAARALRALGGSPRIEKSEGKILIKSEVCPLAAAVESHPEVCRIAEALVSEIVGARVREICDRDGAPRCVFEIADAA